VWQADQPLAMQRVGIGSGIGDRVAQPVIDRHHAGGARIAEPRELKRRGLAREYREAVVLGVA
jgi:hypothetical protein